MDRTYRCVVPGVTVAAAEYGRSFRPGDLVDVAARVRPNGPTWGEAIGPHIETHFAPVVNDDAGAVHQE